MSEDLKADVMKAAQRANELKNTSTQSCQSQGKSFDQPMKSQFTLDKEKEFGNPQIIQEGLNKLGDD